MNQCNRKHIHIFFKEMLQKISIIIFISLIIKIYLSPLRTMGFNMSSTLESPERFKNFWCPSHTQKLAKQKKRHRCTKQTFGLCGRRQGWDVSREQHQNMYIIKGETDHQPRLDAWDKCSGLVHWEDPEGWDEAEAGGGIGMGNTCKSMADSCQCMAKITTIL